MLPLTDSTNAVFLWRRWNVLQIPEKGYYQMLCVSSINKCLLFYFFTPHYRVVILYLLEMFYSDSLLSKTGKLAQVWLSANLERKLSKTHVMQSNIESSVGAIVEQGTSFMTLRLSGQLLLGVVRIYSRKAKYLLGDCNNAWLNIGMVCKIIPPESPSYSSHAGIPP